jgi:hypothetical protein
MKFGATQRIALVLSALWALSWLAAAFDSPSPVVLFIVTGVIPLVVAWGVAWVSWEVRSRRALQRQNAAASPSVAVAASRYGRPWMGASLLVVAFAIVGLGAHFSEQDPAYRIGQNLVYFGFVALLLGLGLSVFDKRGKVSFPVTVGGVCIALASGAALSDYTETRSAREFIDKALPLISRLQDGEAVTVTEIRAARIGRFEPVLIALRSSYAQQQALVAEYQDAVNAAGLDGMLRPDSLTPDRIDLSLSALSSVRSALGLLQSKARASEEQTVALFRSLDISENFKRGLVSGAEDVSAENRKIVDAIWASEKDALDAIEDMLRFVRGASGRYVVKSGEIYFAQQRDLARYRELWARINNAGESASVARKRAVEVQAERMKRWSNQRKSKM